MIFRGIDPPMNGRGFGCGHSRCAIDTAFLQLRWQHEIAVVHSQRFKEPRSNELPERLTAHAANDVSQQNIAKVRIKHCGTRAARQWPSSGQSYALVEHRMLSGSRRRQFGRL